MIRRLESTEADILQDLRLSSLKSAPYAYLSSFEREVEYSLTYFERLIQQCTKAESFGFWAFFKDNIPVGYFRLQQKFLPKTRHVCDLFELFVLPENRSQGIATLMIQKAVEECTKHPEIEYLYLETNSGNPKAISLYEHLGFTKNYVLPQSIKTADQTYLDTLHYSFKTK